VTAVAFWALPAGVDDVTRESARRAAERELVKPAYHHTEPLLLRALNWFIRQVLDLLDRAALAAPGGKLGLVGFVVLVVLVVLAVRYRVGRLAATGRGQSVFDSRRLLTAQEHRSAAEAAAAAGEWAVAVRERFRGLVRGLEERTVLEPKVGRTADEAVAEAGGALPAAARAMGLAARAFDDVVYGGRTADEQSYVIVAGADEAALSARPVLV